MPALKINKSYDSSAVSAAHQLSSIKVLSVPLNWSTYADAGIISAEQLALISSYDGQSLDQKKEKLPDVGERLAEFFIYIWTNVKTEDILRYSLALADEMTRFSETNVSYFLSLDPYQSLFVVLNRSEFDLFTVLKSGELLALLLVKSRTVNQEAVSSLFKWINDHLSSTQKELHLQVILGSLQVLLRRDEYRLQYLEKDGLQRLSTLMSSHEQHFQILYQVIYCFWLMTYNSKICEKFEQTNIIHKLADILKKVTKEKVIRVCLATMHNLMGKANNNQQMIEAGSWKTLENLNNKKWADEDIIQALTDLLESLGKNIDALSSYDMYKHEVLSGNLEWSPVHKSEKFWKENVHKFEEDNYKMIHILHEILKSSPSSQVVAVACYDLGEFVRTHPRGKRVLRTTGIKDTITNLMKHQQDPEVQKHALLCIQKVMIQNWEYVGAGEN